MPKLTNSKWVDEHYRVSGRLLKRSCPIMPRKKFARYSQLCKNADNAALAVCHDRGDRYWTVTFDVLDTGRLIPYAGVERGSRLLELVSRAGRMRPGPFGVTDYYCLANVPTRREAQLIGFLFAELWLDHFNGADAVIKGLST